MFRKEKAISRGQFEENEFMREWNEKPFSSNYAQGSSFTRDTPYSGFRKLLLKGPWNE